jgi:nucleoside-diphosphate-sugar epimerase
MVHINQNIIDTDLKILLTGATGFIGSNLLFDLLDEKHEVCLLIRKNSNLSRISNQIERCRVEYFDNIDILNFKADIVLHLAWYGVSSRDRDNFDVQIENLSLLKGLLEYCKINKVQRFIGFGSQAEYGYYDGIVSEESPLRMENSYGVVKNLCQFYISNFCSANKISWNWLRLFSFYGINENNEWFLTWLISNILNEKAIEMTPGEQRYAYMHLDDLNYLIKKIFKSNNTMNKIYNISSQKDLSLKEIVLKCKSIIKPKKFNVEFGSKEYRKNQIMLMKGTMSKLFNDLDIVEFKEKNFNTGLTELIHNFK